MEAQPQLQTVALGGRVLAIVPLDDYDALRNALEDAADAEAMRRALAEPTRAGRPSAKRPNNALSASLLPTLQRPGSAKT